MVIITPHAIAELKRRGISREDIMEAVLNPEQTQPGYGGRKVCQRRMRVENKAYLLRVIVEVQAQDSVVVTAYRTSKLKKYGEKI